MSVGTKQKAMLSGAAQNILASIIYLAALQLLIYPLLGRTMPADEYGRVLLLMGFCNIFAVVYGTALYNTRLVTNLNYEKKQLNGDFNPLFMIACLCNVATIFAVTYIFDDAFSTVDTALVAMLSIMEMFRNYYAVRYTLALDFKKILMQNVWYCIGAILGVLLYSQLHTHWIIPFMMGTLAACIYNIVHAEIKQDKLMWTPIVKNTIGVYIFLMLSLLLSNITSYLDRLVLYPFMGGSDVAIYTTAVFFGKSLSIFLNPLTNVLMAYFAKKDSISLSSFVKQAVLFLAMGVAFFLFTLTGVAEWATGILYPTLIAGAIPYMTVGNLSAIILGVSIMMQPAVMKFCKAKWQPIIQGVNIAIAFGLGILWLKDYGLIGFCWASVLAGAIKVGMLLIVGIMSFRKDKNKEKPMVVE